MSNAKLLSPKEAAKRLGVSTKTISRWVDTGKIQAFRDPTKMRRIPLSEVERLLGKPKNTLRCCIYIRVRAKKDLTNGVAKKQEDNLLAVANTCGYEVTSTILEIGTALKENRSCLIKMLNQALQREFDVLLVNDKSSVVPFGFSYFQELLSLLGIQVNVVHQTLSILSVKEALIDTLTILIKLSKVLSIKENEQTVKTIWVKLYQVMRSFKNL